MKGRSTLFKGFLVAVIVGLMLFACSCNGNNGPAWKEGDELNLTLAADAVGGFWHDLGKGIGELIEKEIPGVTVTVVEGDSVTNLKGINEKQFDLGFCWSEMIDPATKGVEPFDTPHKDFTVIGALYNGVYQMAVWADSGINSVSDLKGKRINPGLEGCSSDKTTQAVLDMFCLSYGDMENVEFVDFDEGIDLMGDDRIDALIVISPIPAEHCSTLDGIRPIKLLPLTNEEIAKLQAINPGYLKGTVYKDTYNGLKEDVPALVTPVQFVVRKDLPIDLVCRITRILAENDQYIKDLGDPVKNFDVEYMNANGVGTYHSGAKRYYIEKGLLGEVS